MKHLNLLRAGLKGAFLFALMVLPQLTNAQEFFTYHKGDVLVGFRRPSNPTYEVVGDLSNILSLVKLSVGSVTNITVYSTNNLNDAFGASEYTNLQWSVLATFQGSTAWSNYPANTVWFTVPRTVPSTQTTPPPRAGFPNSGIENDIYSIGLNAPTISSGFYSGTNSDNNFQTILEPVDNNDPGNNYEADTYSYFVAEQVLSASYGDAESDFAGAISFGVENVTPAPFTSAQVSDFYQLVPNGKVDPTTTLTTGNATYLGYFTLNPNGAMTFTRQSSSGGGSNPPPPSTLTITRVNGTNTINFTTTNGATYTLYFTNSTGLTQPIHTWPSVSTNVTGNGSINSFIDVTSDTNRFYIIGGH